MRTNPSFVVLLLAFSLPNVADVAKADDAGLLKKYGIEPTAAGTTTFLLTLRPDETAHKKAAEWVGQLGDASFTVREAATHGLLELSIVPVIRLRAAATSADLETATRAKRILDHPATIAKLHAAAQQRELAAAVLRTIGEKSIGNTTSALLEVAPFLEDDELAGLAADAMAKVADAEAIPTLRKSLAENIVPVRIIAIRGLSKAAGRSARDELRTLYLDSNPRIVLAAAHALAEQADRSCLKVLVQLLGAEDVAVRARAVQVLRASTNQKIALNPFRKPDEQKSELDAWKTWLAAHGETVQLQRPLKLSALSEDLDRGLLVHYSFDHDAEGRLKDASGHSRDGECHNAVEFVSRGRGRAIEFKGHGHHGAEGGHAILPFIDFPSLKEFSLALWVRELNMTHEEGEAYVTFGIDRGVGTADALGIAHLNSSVIFRVGDGQVSVPFAAADRDRWVHYAMTFQNGQLHAFKDGERIGDTSARIFVSSRRAALARHWWANGNGTSTRFQGAMDDVRIYDRALTAEQIHMLKEATK
jgi:hypothetical protein